VRGAERVGGGGDLQLGVAGLHFGASKCNHLEWMCLLWKVRYFCDKRFCDETSDLLDCCKNTFRSVAAELLPLVVDVKILGTFDLGFIVRKETSRDVRTHVCIHRHGTEWIRWAMFGGRSSTTGHHVVGHPCSPEAFQSLKKAAKTFWT